MIFDCAVVGAGVMGCSTALHLARGGMQVALLDRGAICGEASGANAGALTMQAASAALIPYALRAHEMWLHMASWCDGRPVPVTARPGVSIAFTEAEAARLEEQARVRRRSAAPIELVSGGRAMEIEPGLTDRVLLAGHCPVDGIASAHLTGRAFRPALLDAGIALFEKRAVDGVDRQPHGFTLHGSQGLLRARRIVMAGGAWLEGMAAWLGVALPMRLLAKPLVVTERIRPVMRTVLCAASGHLSLTQDAKGGVLIGGGWAIGASPRNELQVQSDDLRETIRLAARAIPALREARVLRAWLGLEADTANGMPAIGPIPGVPDAWMIGGVQPGYLTGPYLGMLLARSVLGQEPEMPLFPPDRLLVQKAA